MGLLGGDGRVVAEVTRIGLLPGTPVERAHALLEPLHHLVPFDAAWISLLDPERRVQPLLVRQGYPARVLQHLDGPQLAQDIEALGLHRHRPPMRIKDMRVPAAEIAGWADYLHPAGFNEGIAVPLTTPDGRYLGTFVAHTETAVAPSDRVRDLCARLSPLIAHAVDPLRAVATLAGLVADAVAGVVLTRGGNVVVLPGLPGDGLLCAGSPLLAVAGRVWNSGRGLTTFLAARDDTGVDTDDAELVRVTVLACPPQPPGHLCAVVLLSPPPDLRGLTLGELRILGLLTEGWPSARIAVTLSVAEPVVAGHLARIMAKLDAGSPMVAAVRALRQGLYLPHFATAGGDQW